MIGCLQKMLIRWFFPEDHFRPAYLQWFHNLQQSGQHLCLEKLECVRGSFLKLASVSALRSSR